MNNETYQVVVYYSDAALGSPEWHTFLTHESAAAFVAERAACDAVRGCELYKLLSVTTNPNAAQL
jgi:hypothetical protein